MWHFDKEQVPHLRTELPGPNARALLDRDTAFVSPSYTRAYPLVVDQGSGAVIRDVDGKGRHSPYAAAFMRNVKRPGMPIEQFFKKVRLLVNESTDGQQTPWESSSLTADFRSSENPPWVTVWVPTEPSGSTPMPFWAAA